VSVYIGMKARTSGAVQGISFLVLLPLAFGSNVFVPIATMPGWLQTFVNANPLTQLVSSVRGLFLGGPVAEHVGWTLVWMIVLVAVFMPLALRAYKKKA